MITRGTDALGETHKGNKVRLLHEKHDAGGLFGFVMRVDFLRIMCLSICLYKALKFGREFLYTV